MEVRQRCQVLISGGEVRQRYIDMNKNFFHVLNTWRIYYEYTSTPKQFLTSVFKRLLLNRTIMLFYTSTKIETLLL